MPDQLDKQPRITPGGFDKLIAADEFRRLGDEFRAFCPFTALNMAKQEIRHSAFLAWCLTPGETHGWGVDFLEAFLRTTLPETKWDDCDFAKAWARREWQNIDVMVEVPRKGIATPIVVAIEMKINAQQGETQLATYRERVEAHWPKQSTRCFLYLRKEDEEPKDYQWKPINYEDVADALTAFWQTPPRGNTGALQLLSSYRSLLNREFIMTNELETMADKLWKDHAAVLNYLADRRPAQDWNGLIAFLKDDKAEMKSDESAVRPPGKWLANKISLKGRSAVFADRGNNMAVRFSFVEWQKRKRYKSGDGRWSEGRILMVELEVKAEKIRIKLQLGPGDQAVRNDVKGVFDNTSTGQIHTTLASRTLLARTGSMENNDVAEIVKEIAEAARDFLKKELPDDKWEKLLKVLDSEDFSNAQ